MDRAEMITKIDNMCQKYDRKDYPGIAIGVVEEGELIFSRGYGMANLDYDIPIDENTVFHVCSITKQFTAACIALLIEEGKLSLYQDIRNIFPELNDCGNKITINNLVHMTNGMPDVYNTANFVCGIREDEGITRQQFWKYVKACDWTFFKPGERWSYGNTGYFLLGQIVEAVSKTSLSQFADEHIFKPLGMNNTFIRDDRTKIIKNRAVGYSYYNHVHYNDSYKRYTSRNDVLSINEENVEVGGAGQLWTTIKDFYLWDKNFYNNILGKSSPKLIEMLTTSGLLTNGEKCGYGYGLFVGDYHGCKIVHHGGSAGGYSAYYSQLPEKKSSVIVFGNHTDFYENFVCENGIVPSVLKLFMGYDKSEKIQVMESVKANVNQIKLDLDLSGKFIDPATSCIWNIRKNNDVYRIEDSFGNITEILYYGNDIFKSEDKEKTYTVVQNDKQAIECIHLQDRKANRTFYPFCREKATASSLKIYEGSYCCEKLGTTYNVKAVSDKLFISNENIHEKAMDLYYTPAVKDTFVCVPNSYISNYCITFNRNSNNEIVSFSYRDAEQTLIEKFVFVKMD